MLSQKFKNIENNLKAMIQPLENSQSFLRYLKNLNDYPLEQSYYDLDGNEVSQPDIPMPYDLIENGDILFTMFQPKISTEKKVHMFFYHLRSKFYDTKSGENDGLYKIDITIPIEYVYIKGSAELRQERLSNIINECLDQQNITGTGKIFCLEGSEWIDSQEYAYQGISLIFNVKDIMKTDEDLGDD
jgi:hypothetical protein